MEGRAPQAQRDFSVVVFGASGVTGRNVAAYLAERAGELGAGWAVAGRDPAKLERVLAGVGVEPPETIVADVADPASLAAMAARTHVVLDLVGPYTLYGPPVIEACLDAGTHYADLTGEMPFVRRTIDAHHERAAAAGVKVVQTSGFEALPPDLAVLMAAETARERWGEDLDQVDVVIDVQPPRPRIGLAEMVSGGTLQSGGAQIGGEDAELMADPAALVTDPDRAAAIHERSPLALAPRFDSRGDVIAPMAPAAFINPPVIQRTAALLAAGREGASRPFRYREGLAMPGGTASLPLRYAAAGALAGMQSGLAALSRSGPTVRRRAAAAMRRLLPGSGFGPTGEELEDWTWQLFVEARTTRGHHVRVEVEADGHPGYLTTSRMLGETGLLLAEEGATPPGGGCLTPALALGTQSVERFERAGLHFLVVS